MNKPLAVETEHLFSIGTLLANMEWGYFTGDFEVQASYQWMCRIRLWIRVCLSVGEPGGIPFLGTLRDI
jgi:hypothetical protein